MSRLLLTSVAVLIHGVLSQGLAADPLMAQRMASKEAVQEHSRLHPTHVCAANGGDWHTDIVAFPAGRADRMYIFSAGAAWAFQIRSGQAALVWCG
ncbi:hypothetical protein [Deinococcus depolymerans]|uniref:Uncharacterized protein n=1 Tax=Deinococcus depolymerans TaxID=392408 RepID=A0ABN1CLQ3_9DEIO